MWDLRGRPEFVPEPTPNLCPGAAARAANRYACAATAIDTNSSAR
jgi:hypothetical protein